MKTKTFIIYGVIFLIALAVFGFLLFPGQKTSLAAGRKIQNPVSLLCQIFFQLPDVAKKELTCHAAAALGNL